MDLINAKAHLKKEDVEPEGENNNEMKIGIVFFIMSLAFGTLFAFSLDNAISNSQWVLFFVLGTIVISVITLNALVNSIGKWRVLTVLVFFAPNLFFSFSLIGVVLLGIASLIMAIYAEKIYNSMGNMRKINIGQALSVGVSGILFATSIAVASQYFVVISKKDTKDLIPKISNSMVVNNILEKYFVNSENGGVLTIDNFIKKILKTGSVDHFTKLESLIPVNSDLTKNDDVKHKVLNTVNKTISSTENKMVISLRKEISEKINKNLKGDENVIEVFALFLQKQLENTVLSNSTLTRFAPNLFALLLFFALVSTTAIIKFPVVWISSILFRFLEFTQLFRIMKAHKEVEVITFKTKN